MSEFFGGLRPFAAMPKLVLSAITLAALSACGGGGGGDKQVTTTSTDTTANQPAAVETRTGDKIKLGGVVSKGLLGNANVTIWPIKDGAVDRTASLATGSTDDSGNYLTGEFTVPGPFVVEVTAKPCEDTTTGINADKSTCSYHQDEALEAKQYLPGAFNISAVVTAPPANDSNNVSRVNVTLFSDFAIRAAIKAGGLSTTNMAKAQAMVNNLFGTTDLNTVTPKALPTAGSDALSPAEARLSAMLAAASKVANTSAALTAIGCPNVTAGTPDATLCVAQQLAGNATVTNYVGTDATVTAQLDSALQEVVADAGSADLAAVTSTTSDKLTTPSLSVPAPAEDAGAYTVVKNFFADLVNTVRSLFTASEGEATLKQARAFEAATKNVRVSVEVLLNDAGVLEKGVELWGKFDNGSGVVSAFEHRDVNSSSNVPSGLHCKLQVDTGTTNANGKVYADATGSTAPADIARATCRVDYEYIVDWNSGSGSAGVYTYNAVSASHSFMIERSDTVNYTYKSFAVNDTRSVTINFNNGTSSDTSPTGRTFLQNTTGTGTVAGSGAGTGMPPSTVKLWTGTVTVASVDVDGIPNSLQISGDVPEVLLNDGSLLHSSTSPNLGHSQLSTVASKSTNAGTATVTFTGNMVALGADGSSTDYSASFTQGSIKIANNELDSISFTGTLLAGNAKFVGTLQAQRQAYAVVDGGTATITGKLYNLSSPSDTTTTPFIDASITYTQDNSHYDNTQPFATGTNYIISKLSFDGYVTAPSSPKIRLALTGASIQEEDTWEFGLHDADAISGDYFIYNSDGSLKRDVTFAFRAPAGKPAGVAQVTTDIVDPTNKVAFSFGYNGHNSAHDTAQADTWATVYVNKIERGTLNTDTGNLPTVTLNSTPTETFSLDTGTIQY